MKKIAWVTADYFADTDLNYEIFKGICSEYDVDWYIIEGSKPYFTHDKYSVMNDIRNLKIRFLPSIYRTRDPRCLISYLKWMKMIKASKPDIIYYNVSPNPASAIAVRMLDTEKVIFTAHDGKAQNDSSSFGLVRTLSYNLIFKKAKHIIMFSNSQADLLRETYGKKDIHLLRLPLKNFGVLKESKPKDVIRFLSFGHIIFQKNIDLLIEAGNRLFERGYKNIRISINGTCTNWDDYKKLIRHEEIFECNPHFVSNDELLSLFATSHYAVFPYRRVSQSGVLKVAFNYNVPVIVSKLGAFIEEVEEGNNGWFFEAGNVESLTETMEKRIIEHSDYLNIQNKMKLYILSHYSDSAAVSSYLELFNKMSL